MAREKGAVGLTHRAHEASRGPSGSRRRHGPTGCLLTKTPGFSLWEFLGKPPMPGSLPQPTLGARALLSFSSWLRDAEAPESRGRQGTPGPDGAGVGQQAKEDAHGCKHVQRAEERPPPESLRAAGTGTPAPSAASLPGGCSGSSGRWLAGESRRGESRAGMEGPPSKPRSPERQGAAWQTGSWPRTERRLAAAPPAPCR